MDNAGSSAGEAVSKPWEPLAVVDVVCLGLAGTLQGFALLICMHLIRWRKWPPYVSKNVNLVIITTVSGVLWTIASCSSLGFVRWKKGDILAACALEVSITCFPNRPPRIPCAYGCFSKQLAGKLSIALTKIEKQRSLPCYSSRLPAVSETFYRKLDHRKWNILGNETEVVWS